ncbi:DUF2993 domain-containing protein [Vampirovibrio sp.]|uniref:LmeA family phospholipid-binding protein n=1 Tax=Vampirovibrio sp. TaxID=2717857 RepID=UPI00359349E4
MIFSKKRLLTAVSISVLALPWAVAQNTPTQHSVAPAIKAGGVMALDLPDSSAQSISLDILKGRFSDYSVGRVTLTGSGIDFRNGTLQGLKADILAGDFDNLLVDKLALTAPAFSFDTMQLLNNRAFVLSQPVNAQVNLVISEAGINRFLANPKTLHVVEKAVQKQTGGIRLVTFSNPSFSLVGGNKIKLNVTSVVAQGLTVPLQMDGKLAIQAGQLSIQDMHIASGGTDLELPLDVAQSFQAKINELIDFKRLGKNSMVITADSMKISGKTLIIDGHAQLTKLKFGA